MNTIYIILYTLYYVHYTVDESSQKMFFLLNYVFSLSVGSSKQIFSQNHVYVIFVGLQNKYLTDLV